LTALRELAQQQATDITGRADRSAREEDELETVVYEMGQSLADCFYDAEQEDAATKVAPSRSGWRGLRDASLLSRSRTVLFR